LIFKKLINLHLKEEVLLITRFFSSALVLITIKNAKEFRSIFLTFLVCPYLIGSYMVQSGLLTDRSRNLRVTLENISAKEGLHNHSINIISDDLNTANSNSKLIKILLMTQNLGRDLKNLNQLKPNEYTWMIKSDIETNKSENYQIITRYKNLNPWTLIKKKI
tara:strand:- start:9 stop:497 length:489 start_codon:yes stop_codon:yes gene_type:complete